MAPDNTSGTDTGQDHPLRSKPSWIADIPGQRRVFGPYIRSNALERLRVLEVKRYCQVRPAFASYKDGFVSGSGDPAAGDYALTAILRCVLLELQADIAFISLLDGSTQYFIAGTTKSTQPEARSSLESTQWYGCDAVLHAGGLCNRTIRLTGESALYEELDMSNQDYTKSLPFVNGEIARFRYYAGVPIVTPEGHNIGSVFVMANEPADTRLSDHQHRFLSDSATQIMRQLKQAVQALEGERTASFNAAVTSLARAAYTPGSDSSNSSLEKGRRLTALDIQMQLDHIYSRAAKLLLDGFSFNAVSLQEVPLNKPGSHVNGGNVTFLALALTPGLENLPTLPSTLLHQICEHWPEGEIFNRVSNSDGAAMISCRAAWIDKRSPKH